MLIFSYFFFFFFSSRRRHTRCSRDWSSDVCSSDLAQIGDQGFQPLGLFVLHIGFPRSQVGFAAVQKLIPPAGQGRGGYPQFAREGFQILAAQQPQDRCRLAFGRPASPPVAPLFGSPSGRPTGSLRGPRSWFSLFAHRHLHVISHPFSPQFGVQQNPRARDSAYAYPPRAHLIAPQNPAAPRWKSGWDPAVRLLWQKFPSEAGTEDTNCRNKGGKHLAP